MKIGITEVSPKFHRGKDFAMYTINHLDGTFCLTVRVYFHCTEPRWCWKLKTKVFSSQLYQDFSEYTEEELFQQSLVDTAPVDIYTAQKMQKHFWAVVHDTAFEPGVCKTWEIE